MQQFHKESFSLQNQQNKIQIGEHKELVLCAISKTTDIRRRGNQEINRKKILQNLKKNNILNKMVDSDKYFEKLSNYKFIISPEGNGIDCHRHYEALMSGCIPIIEYNKDMERKYKDMPVLYTKDYSEITEEYLISKYKEFQNKKYNFEKLFLSYYMQSLQIIPKKLLV